MSYQPTYRSKLKVVVGGEPSISIDEISLYLSGNYDITYCGIHKVEDDYYIFIQNKNKMSSNVVASLLKDAVTILNIEPYPKGVKKKNEEVFVEKERVIPGDLIRKVMSPTTLLTTTSTIVRQTTTSTIV